MSEAFSFSLTDTDKDYLKNLARLSIGQKIHPEEKTPLPEPPTETLRMEFGAFVTLTIDGKLRGCIGHVIGDKPIYKTVTDMAKAAAFNDPRFPQLSAAEFERLEIEISILSPIAVCDDLDAIEIGRHGLIIQQGGNSGLLLPQVAVDWKWDRKEFLEHTCQKAGLPSGCWRDASTRVLWFEAEVF